MTKLIFLMLLCMFNSGSDAPKLVPKDCMAPPTAAPVAEPMELFNPFLLGLN